MPLNKVRKKISSNNVNLMAKEIALKENIGQTTYDFLQRLAKCTESGDGVTRLFLSKEHHLAIDMIEKFLKLSDIDYSLDNAATIIAKKHSKKNNAKTLIIGSHIDSVRHGGKYDGALGSILPLMCIDALNRNNIDLPFNIECVCFGDEEGVRFPETLLGSKALAGKVESKVLESIDTNGISIAQALRDFGLNPLLLKDSARDKEEIIGFLEVHIEQGPILATNNHPLGVVTSITGIERHQVSFIGETGHAGTVPMEQRRDALHGAAKSIDYIHELLKNTNELVGVVGVLDVQPGSVNSIPNRVNFTIELRSPNKSILQTARQKMNNKMIKIAKELNLELINNVNYEELGANCSNDLVEKLCNAITDLGFPLTKLFSGAGHDGLAMQHLCDIAMIFVRCKDGVSHHPKESVNVEDIQVAAEVLLQFIMSNDFCDDTG